MRLHDMLLGLAVLDGASEGPLELAVMKVGRSGAITYVTTEELPYREGALLVALGWERVEAGGSLEEWSVDDDMGAADEAAVAMAERYLVEAGRALLTRQRAPIEEEIVVLLRPLVARIVELRSRLEAPSKIGRLVSDVELDALDEGVAEGESVGLGYARMLLAEVRARRAAAAGLGVEPSGNLNQLYLRDATTGPLIPGPSVPGSSLRSDPGSERSPG